MLILGIESSCDETAAAVVEDGRKILSSVIASQVEEHRIYGGVVPEIASRRHSEAIVGVVREAMEQSGKTWKELDAIAVTCAPGLIGALLVGVNFAKGLSLSTGLPLVPVHHLRGHIAANYESVREGVRSVMGGKVLDYEAKTILKQGRLEQLFDLVCKNLLSITDAATQANLTEESFEIKMKDYNKKVNKV